MSDATNRRILVADDEAAILAEYRRIFLGGRGAPADPAASLEVELFGRQATQTGPASNW